MLFPIRASRALLRQNGNPAIPRVILIGHKFEAKTSAKKGTKIASFKPLEWLIFHSRRDALLRKDPSHAVTHECFFFQTANIASKGRLGLWMDLFLLIVTR